MVPELTTRDRIKLGCIHLGIKQQDLARKVGTSKQEISHVGSGRYKSGRIVDGIAKVLGVSVEWLTEGTGASPLWANSAERLTSSEIATMEAMLPKIRDLAAATTFHFTRQGKEIPKEIRQALKALLHTIDSGN